MSDDSPTPVGVPSRPELKSAPVDDCSACGGDHESIVFGALPVDIMMGQSAGGDAFTHWGRCPNEGEVVLARFVDDEETDGG